MVKKKKKSNYFQPNWEPVPFKLEFFMPIGNVSGQLGFFCQFGKNFVPESRPSFVCRNTLKMYEKKCPRSYKNRATDNFSSNLVFYSTKS